MTRPMNMPGAVGDRGITLCGSCGLVVVDSVNAGKVVPLDFRTKDECKCVPKVEEELDHSDFVKHLLKNGSYMIYVEWCRSRKP